MITDPNVVGYRGECSCPPGHAVEWAITRRDKVRTVLGTVLARTWALARDVAVARTGLDREYIEVELAKESGR